MTAITQLQKRNTKHLKKTPVLMYLAVLPGVGYPNENDLK